VDYPVDHSRTTRQHAGETMKNSGNAPGLAAAVVAAASLIFGLYEFATGHPSIGAVAVVLAVVLGVAGSGWLFYAHRRVRKAELRLEALSPDAEAPPPTS
jgi:protein-S-isoprenylcysteine O-methyltransferase Ste14